MPTPLYLTNADSAVDTTVGGLAATEKDASFTRGPSQVGYTTGTGSSLQINSAGTQLVWISPPLAAVTISGTITVNLWMFEAAMSGNWGARCEVFRLDPTGAVVSTILSSPRGVEMGTSSAAQNWTASPTSTTLADGDMLGIRVSRASVGVSDTSVNVTLRLAAPGAGTDGDSYVSFDETLSVFSGATLSLGHGSFSCSGQAVALKATRRAPLAHGVFTKSGQDVTFRKGYNFVLDVYSDSGTAFDYDPGETVSGESFSRASAATYTDSSGVVQSAASGVKRDAHYIGATRTLLLEPARSSSFSAPEDLTDAYWNKFNATISANAINAPDGTATADLIVESTANNYHGVYVGSTGVTSGQKQSVSFFAKAGGRNWLLLYFADNATARKSWVNISTGALGTVDATHTIRTTALANGWYKVDVIHDYASITSLSTQFFSTTGDGVETYTGDGSSGVYLWGLQWEMDQPYPTSYMPGGSRAVDAISWPGVTATGATLDEEFTDLATALADTDSNPYTSNASIVPTVGRAYTLVDVTTGAAGTGHRLTGQAMNFARTRNLKLDVAALAETGQAVGLEKGSRLQLAAGSFAETGQPVTLKKGHALPLANGSFAGTGQSLTLRRASKLSLAAGIFLEGGQSILLRRGFRLPMASGILTLNGQALLFRKSFRLVVDLASYSAAGQPALLEFGRRLAAEAGEFDLAGQDVVLSYQQLAAYEIAVEAGLFGLSGQGVLLELGRSTGLESGSFLLSGPNLSLKLGRRIVPDSGLFNSAGQNVNLLTGHALVAGLGSFIETGQALLLEHGRRLSAGHLSAALDGQVVNLWLARSLPVGLGSFTADGQDVALSYGDLTHYSIGVEAAAFAWTGNDLLFGLGRRATVEGGAFQALGQSMALLRGSRLSVEAGPMTMSGQPVTFLHGRVLTIEAGSFLLSGEEVGLVRSAALGIDGGQFSMTGNDVLLQYGSSLAIDLGAATFVMEGGEVSLVYDSRIALEFGDFGWTGGAIGLVPGVSVYEYDAMTGKVVARSRLAGVVRVGDRMIGILSAGSSVQGSVSTGESLSGIVRVSDTLRGRLTVHP